MLFSDILVSVPQNKLPSLLLKMYYIPEKFIFIAFTAFWQDTGRLIRPKLTLWRHAIKYYNDCKKASKIPATSSIGIYCHSSKRIAEQIKIDVVKNILESQ